MEARDRREVGRERRTGGRKKEKKIKKWEEKEPASWAKGGRRDRWPAEVGVVRNSGEARRGGQAGRGKKG